MTWAELFPKASSAAERQRNWSAFSSQHPDIASLWEGDHECSACRYCDGDWCLLQGLPCFYNPILTPGTGSTGMACMGLGFEEGEPCLISR